MAETVYSGESYSFESEEFEYYTVTGNSSNLNGMNVSWENGNTTISFHPLFAPDNFTLIFFNEETEVITEHHYSSGSSSTKYVDKIIEVPNYIDKEIIVEKEIPSEPEIIKEVPEWVYFTFVMLILIILTLMGYIWRIKNERGIKKKRNR
ncbi:unnamed protein product [marine sediment metagenome]|uniref:Uncharacterized protein n=1 Tax=marine sediment metagenome TaxID=412755 RepID=X1A0W1_9ZZZZ